MKRSFNVGIAAAATATVLAGALGLASAQNTSDDAINQAAQQGSSTSAKGPAGGQTPAQIEVDNGNKMPGGTMHHWRHRAPATTQAAPSDTADTTSTTDGTLPPKADRN